MTGRLRAALPWVYLAGLVWLNAYIVHHVFSLSYTGATHSMHGFWIALGRAMGDRWLAPQRVPWWAGGMPAELTYAPLVPWLSTRLGLYPLMAAVYVLSAIAVYLLAWQLSAKPGWSFIAALAYSLLSPTELLLPDAGFSWIHVLAPRRLNLSLSWDEAPHQLALAKVCLAVAAWARGWPRAAIAAIALGALANPFAVTAAALFGLCWTLATGQWRLIAFTGVLAYLLVCPFYPPSLLQILRANGATAPESAWTDRSWIGVAAFVAALAVAWFLTRRWTLYRRFVTLLAVTTSTIPLLFHHWGIVVLQQPARYKSEMEAAIVLAAVFAAERLLSTRPRWLLVALALPALWFATEQTIRHRRFAKNAIRAAAPEASIEYQAAQAAGSRTVFAPGSIAQWMNVYRDVRQYTGASFSTALNPIQQRVALEVTTETSWQRFMTLMQAAGVDAVFLPGRQSPEFWKPFANDILAGHLSVLWEERDTRLYEVPRPSRSQAETTPAATALSIDWLSHHRARIHGPRRPGEHILVHINWHSAWRAYQNGQPVPTPAGPLGQLIIQPAPAPGAIELRYEPAWTTRIVSLIALLFLPFRHRRPFSLLLPVSSPVPC